ncbi:hypothetical protein ACOJBO_03830 [Rhizobium beringeri]
MERDAPTNLSVVTTKRTYSFDLEVNDSKAIQNQTFKLQLMYPEDVGLKGHGRALKQAQDAERNPQHQEHPARQGQLRLWLQGQRCCQTALGSPTTD